MLSRDYLEWLYFMFGDNKVYDITLFEILGNIEYRYRNDLDYNRACGGIQLRQRYAYETGIYEDEVAIGSCSVLEMMCALSKEMYMQTSQFNPSHFMLDMIHNLQLLQTSYDGVKKIVERWMDGKFSSDGCGSLFYIPGVNEDMRKLDVWSRMCLYLNTYYPLDSGFNF